MPGTLKTGGYEADRQIRPLRFWNMLYISVYMYIRHCHIPSAPHCICSSRKGFTCMHEVDNKLLVKHTDCVWADGKICPDVVFVSCGLLKSPVQFSGIHLSG